MIFNCLKGASSTFTSPSQMFRSSGHDNRTLSEPKLLGGRNELMNAGEVEVARHAITRAERTNY